MRELSVRQDKVHEYSGRNVVADYFSAFDLAEQLPADQMIRLCWYIL